MQAAESTVIGAPLIEADDLAIGYHGRAIACGISLRVTAGELWGVLGPNGAGKTTLVRTLMGAMRPLGGSVRHTRSLRFGYVKQRDALHDLYPFTVEEVVVTGRYRGALPFYRPGRHDHEAIDHALERTGILDLRHQPVRELSGGQRQRVLLARALCGEPDVIIMDEPTNDMDIAGEDAVLHLIRDVHEETGAAVIIISHLLPTVLRIAERLIFVDQAKTAVFTKAEFIADNHLERFYGMPIRITGHEDGSYTVSVQHPAPAAGEERDHAS